MAIPKLALIPATQGTKLYSVLPSNGVGDFAFTRAGSATRINSQGLIETVASGVSRLNYPLIDGVVNGCPSHLLEPQRINLLKYSEDFSQGYWSNTGIQTPYIADVVSPTGELNAYTLEISSGEVNGGGIFRAISVSGTKSISVFAKKKNTKYLIIGDEDINNDGVWFNLENGLVATEYGSANGSIENYGNGWYRCIMTYTKTSSLSKFIYFSNIDGTAVNSVVGGDSVYIWGAQLEQGSYPTSYIPNYGTTATVTRSAETANGAGDASTFNDSEGVLFAEIASLDNSTVERISIADGSNNNRVYFTKTGVANEIRFAIVDGGSSQASITKAVNDNTSMHKIAGKYKANDVAFWINGFEVGTDTNAIMPSGLNELAFDSGNGSLDFYGNTKQIQYFDSALNDSDLETLTSWVSFQDMANGQIYSIK